MGCTSDASNSGPGGKWYRWLDGPFAISGNYLYTVSNSHLQAYNITAPQSPESANKISLGLNIETIFPYGDKLFIGSRTGMHIYDNTNPAKPVFLSRFDHVQSCDPVVVQGELCLHNTAKRNQLPPGTKSVDIVNIQNPRLRHL